jgi:hypothetical protein
MHDMTAFLLQITSFTVAYRASDCTSKQLQKLSRAKSPYLCTLSPPTPAFQHSHLLPSLFASPTDARKPHSPTPGSRCTSCIPTIHKQLSRHHHLAWGKEQKINLNPKLYLMNYAFIIPPFSIPTGTIKTKKNLFFPHLALHQTRNR